MTKQELEESIKLNMTIEIAHGIKSLYVGCNYSYRKIAFIYHEDFTLPWKPADNQQAGRILVGRAAKILGEDWAEEKES